MKRGRLRVFAQQRHRCLSRGRECRTDYADGYICGQRKACVAAEAVVVQGVGGGEPGKMLETPPSCTSLQIT